MAVCFKPIRGTRIRMTEVDSCGVPVPGGQYVTSSGFTTVTITPETEDGTAITVLNAGGELCVNERSPDNLLRLDAQIDFCEVDPAAFALATGWPEEVDEESGDPVGFRIEEGPLDSTWALEVWTNLAGGTACGDEGQCWGYVLLPFLFGGSVGDFTIENAAVTFSLTASTRGGSGWGYGPWDITTVSNNPEPLFTPVGSSTHGIVRQVCLEPPAAVCGAQTIPGSPGD